MELEEARALEIVRNDCAIEQGRAFEHVMQTFRWIMATLFAANGGALLAFANRSSDAILDAWAIRAFGAGLVFALLMGVLSAVQGQRMSVKIGQLRAKIDVSLISDHLDQTILSDMETFKPSWKTWYPSYAGVISLCAFVMGLIRAVS